MWKTAPCVVEKRSWAPEALEGGEGPQLLLGAESPGLLPMSTSRLYLHDSKVELLCLWVEVRARRIFCC